jgi:hypothetical protein
LIREDGEIKGVEAKSYEAEGGEEGECIEIKAPIVIGADRIESKVGEWAKIFSKPEHDVSDVDSSTEYLLEGIDTEKGIILNMRSGDLRWYWTDTLRTSITDWCII